MNVQSNEQCGRFDTGAGEFEITTPATPREWYNYLWNAEYVALFSQTAQGESLTQDGVGRRIAIVSGRMVFLRDRDSGGFQTLNALPVDAARTAHRCRHGMGYSVIEQTADGIESTLQRITPWCLRIPSTVSAHRSRRSSSSRPISASWDMTVVMESGDLALLAKRLPFNDGSVASLYEHVKRAVACYCGDLRRGRRRPRAPCHGGRRQAA
jgi:cellobiose phosphorylase